ncbi:hypothetical protein Q8A73_016731 [Channa argus]|nr:hypothetical protein Q8A73_016731 [Channa argus]
MKRRSSSRQDQQDSEEPSRGSRQDSRRLVTKKPQLPPHFRLCHLSNGAQELTPPPLLNLYWYLIHRHTSAPVLSLSPCPQPQLLSSDSAPVLRLSSCAQPQLLSSASCPVLSNNPNSSLSTVGAGFSSGKMENEGSALCRALNPVNRAEAAPAAHRQGRV